MGEFAIICPDHCTKHHSSLPSPFAMRCQRAMFSTVQSPIGPPHTHTYEFAAVVGAVALHRQLLNTTDYPMTCSGNNRRCTSVERA